MSQAICIQNSEPILLSETSLVHANYDKLADVCQ